MGTVCAKACPGLSSKTEKLLEEGLPEDLNSSYSYTYTPVKRKVTGQPMVTQKDKQKMPLVARKKYNSNN